MSNFIFFLQRIFFPVLVSGCITIKPVSTSLFYAILIFLSPYIKVAQINSRSLKLYFLFGFLTSLIVIIIQGSLQLVWLTGIQNLNPREYYILRQIGFIEFKNLNYLQISRWILSDILVCINSLLVYIVIKRSIKKQKEEDAILKDVTIENDSMKPRKQESKINVDDHQEKSLSCIATNTTLSILCIIGAICPSVINGIYFVSFLISSTCRGCNIKLERKFAICLRILSFILSLHIIIVILYQVPMIQDLIPPKNLTTRLLSLHNIVINSSHFAFNINLQFDFLMHPFLLMIGYLIITSSSNYILIKQKTSIIQDEEKLSNVKMQTPTEGDSFVETNEIAEKSEEKINTFVGVLKTVKYFLLDQSYIVTIFSMMIWAIVYHSWLGFFFLIASNTIWILPEKKEKILKLSPIIVCYAMCLIIINYIYGMDFNYKTVIGNQHVNLIQVGLTRYEKHPVGHLFLKSILFLSFLITLKEKFDRKVFKISGSTSKIKQVEFKSKITGKIVEIFKKVIVFVWMWIIILLLFILAISNNSPVTLFRIINMVFFLLYFLVFQLSFRIWKHFMYLFWIALIVYAEVSLILIYAYQFDNFPKLTFQKEIGLEKRDTSALFLELLSFTIITMLSGLQLNYFHQKFLKTWTVKLKEKNYHNENKTLGNKEKLKKIMEIVYKLMNVHFYKIYFFIVFWRLTLNTQMLNLIMMILLTIGGAFSSDHVKSHMMKFVSLISMLFICGIMLHDMVQSQNQTHFENSTCIFDGNLSVKGFIERNFENWFHVNFQKRLFSKISLQFWIIITSSLFYGFKRFQHQSKNTKKIIFENISGKDADKSLINMTKFFINYGFYKFGVEISLFVMITIVFLRLDFISIIYLSFFVILTLREREKQEKFWSIITYFIMFSILLQILSIAFLLIMDSCKIAAQKYTTNILLFMYNKIVPLKQNPGKLAYDFMLLIVMSCQCSVFEDEKTIETSNSFQYEGSNIPSSTIKHGNFNLHESTYSFGKNTKNHLMDLLKKYIFKAQFWVTLAIVFYSGTQQIDIFSLGYVTGAFIFLWQGTDFYLKPLNQIMKWWNFLLIFNVATIVIKICIRVFACHFGKNIPHEFCWISDAFDLPCANEKFQSNFCANLINDHAIYWDGITFVCIIIQRRIFLSHYFSNTIYDTFATTLLSSRGAQMIEDMRAHEVNRALDEEKKNLDVIKKKVEVIKNFAIIKNIESGKVKDHDTAIRSGGYYMFSDDLNLETESLQEADISLNDAEPKVEPKLDVPIETSAKSGEKLGSFITHSRNLKEYCFQFFQKVINHLHKLSRKHTFIMKVLQDEKKIIKETMSPSSSGEDVIGKLNSTRQSQQLSLLKKIDDDFWKKLELNFDDVHENYNVTLGELLHEFSYFLMTYSHLLVYFVIVINQIISANVLSIAFPLSIFLWGTLTFPRPTKAFWILIIAYTQTMILLKCIFQFDIKWWNKNHSFTKMLGTENFAFYDLILLLTLFLHRAVLKMLGLWRSDDDFEFNEGSYQIISCDTKTSALINLQQHQKHSEEKSENKLKYMNEYESQNILVDDEFPSKILFRHNIDKNSDGEGYIKSIIKDRYELIKAEEIYSKNNRENFSIQLKQDDTNLKLFLIDVANTSKIYSSDDLVIVEHTIEEPMNFFLPVLMASLKNYSVLITRFFQDLLPPYHIPRKPVDVYTFMFFCDFINFLVLLFGFTEFAIQPTKDDSRSILNYFEENKVPTSLLLLLVIQFAVIIIDRMLYLRKSMLGKVIFHFSIIFTTHIWMFFIMPVITNKSFNSTSPPVIFYCIKCIYILLSAYQICCGPPARILGNFLMEKYDLMHMVGFKIFMIIPFLFELRTLIDWTCTATSLTFKEWIRIETIYAQAFGIKCKRLWDSGFKRGVKKSWFLKIFMGGGLTLIIVLILWFPLLLFAYSNALGQPNIPTQFSMSIHLGSYNEPLYKVNLRQDSMYQFKSSDWMKLIFLYEKYPLARQYLKDFDEKDVVLIKMNVNSSTLWNASPPSVMRLVNDLKNGKLNSLSVTYKIGQISYFNNQEATETINHYIDQNTRNFLVEVLQGSSDVDDIIVPSVLPKLLMIRNNGKASIIRELLLIATKNDYYRDIRLEIHKENGSSWWQVNEICNDTMHKELFSHFPFNDCSNFLNIYIFNEKLFPSTISSLAVKGVIGLYVTIIFVFSRFLRSSIFHLSTSNIIVEELPNVDKILSLCKNIHMVREAHLFKLEEDLVAKLLFLYRSPETLIKWTKFKES